MKKTLITILTALTFSVCAQETAYTITGTIDIPELEGKPAVLGRWSDREKIDTVVIANGTFKFIGNIEQPTYYWISINPEDRNNNIVVNLILENAKISVTVDSEKNSKITGTKNNDILQNFSDAERVLSQKINDAWRASRDARQTRDEELAKSFNEEYRKYNEELRTFKIEFAKNNINNAAGQSQLRSLLGLPLEQLKGLIVNANVATLQVPEVARVVERIEGLERTAIGQPFTDLRMPDVNGNEIALSDFAGKGKYVLIDFTATWCGPCRLGKPAMIATYNRFKDKGFEIVGVWFDNTHEAWATGMKALNMPDWPQMSDLKGWGEAAKIYGIHGIPHAVLIDPNGIIIARGLRGDDLDKKLEEIFGN